MLSYDPPLGGAELFDCREYSRSAATLAKTYITLYVKLELRMKTIDLVAGSLKIGRYLGQVPHRSVPSFSFLCLGKVCCFMVSPSTPA